MSAPTMTGPRVLGSSAAQLLARVAADPAAPVHAVVTGPGGYGKTTLLSRLDDVYRRAGIAVATPWRPAAGTGAQALLVDDAHLLDARRLGDLAEYAERPDARIVVAHRPWPRSAALLRLADVLRRTQPAVILSTWTEEQIGGRAELARFVASQTGGVPRYAVRLLAALDGSAPPHRIPAAALSPFASELDELDPDLRTLLLAVEAGAGLSFDLVAALLERDAETIAELVDAGRATGLLSADGTLIPLARHAIAALAPIGQRIDVRQRLAALQLARGGPVLPLVRPLLTADESALVPGAAGHGLGRVYEAAGEEALRDDPALAAQLFAAAAGAGRTTAARRALATALSGDLDRASQLADQALAAGSADQRSEAAYVAAAALTHRGQTAQAVALYPWCRSTAATGFATVGLVGVGRLPSSEPEPGAEPPTALSATAALMARAMVHSVTGSPTAALSALVQASTLIEPAGATVLLPDSPAALGATLAMHCAELDAAESLLVRAIRAGTGGVLLTDRHRLLLAWVAMLRGRAVPAPDTTRPGRDLLLGTALRVGLIRRSSDPVGLRSIWPDACQALIGQPVDLFNLLPLGELVVAAARLGEQHRVAGHLAEADRLLDDLGRPPLWTGPLLWSRLHAAILAEDLAAAERDAAALVGMRGFSPYAAAAADAATAWLDVLTDRTDPEAVMAAARALAALGLTWDGTRLAGQAAIRTSDRKAMTLLLDCARALQERVAGPGEPARATGGDQTLSDREREVAALVLAGLTYKQVAERLYISAKTVEHHMARIRQRLGCTDRQELLTQLRALIGDAVEGGPR